MNPGVVAVSSFERAHVKSGRLGGSHIGVAYLIGAGKPKVDQCRISGERCLIDLFIETAGSLLLAFDNVGHDSR